MYALKTGSLLQLRAHVTLTTADMTTGAPRGALLALLGPATPAAPCGLLGIIPLLVALGRDLAAFTGKGGGGGKGLKRP